VFHRILTLVVCLAAIASVVAAIGMRVRATRMTDPAQILRTYVPDVPVETSKVATLVGRSEHSVQIELRADLAWVRTFADRNGFKPVTGELIGMSAERWTRDPDKPGGAILHLMKPLDGGDPALLTISEESVK